MKLILGLHHEQKLEAELKLEHQMALTQSMDVFSERLNERAEDSDQSVDDVLLKSIVKELAGSITNETLKQSIEGLMDVDSLRELILARGKPLAFPKSNLEFKKTLKNIVATFFYHGTAQGGKIIFKDAKGYESSKEVDRGNFEEAYLDPGAIEEKISQFGELLRREIAGEGMNAGWARLRHAKEAVQELRPQMDMMVRILEALFSLRREGQAPVSDFLKGLVVEKEAKFIISARLLSRFTTRFSTKIRTGKEEEFKIAFTNLIAEYVLIAMGVLDPEIFQLMSLHKELVKNEKSEKKGGRFWQCRRLKGKPISGKSDQEVLRFITKTARESSDRLCEETNFHALFSGIQMEASNYSGKGELTRNEEFREFLQNEFVEFLSSKSVQKALLKEVKDRWYPELDQFLS